MSKTRNLANSTPQFSRDALIVPTGNTAQRPTVTAGYIRFNTDLNTLESANSTAWANVGSGSSSATSSSNVTSLTGNVYISAAGGIVDSSNVVGAFILPSGTTAQRPASVANGAIRWNTSNTAMEIYAGGATGWLKIAGTSYTVDYLVVGGGGSGGSDSGGGGGAGGMLSGSNISVTPGTAYGVTVGAGGSATYANPVSGTSSSFSGVATSLGGGGGGSPRQAAGAAGGSGGGSARDYGGAGGGGAGTSGQGYPGGSTPGTSWASASGGGGAGGSGTNGGTNSGGPDGQYGGSGGTGITSSITGTSTYYAGGGGGLAIGQPGGSGGPGGGGSGSNSGTGISGGTNLGGGGGGSAGAGGSGIVVIRYAGTVARATGGTVSITGGYVIHTFTTSGTFTA